MCGAHVCRPARGAQFVYASQLPLGSEPPNGNLDPSLTYVGPAIPEPKFVKFGTMIATLRVL
jgi:hypothetical protein